MAILIVFSPVLRLALIVWLGISALVWAVIFGMIESFKIFCKLPNRTKEQAEREHNSISMHQPDLRK